MVLEAGGLRSALAENWLCLSKTARTEGRWEVPKRSSTTSLLPSGLACPGSWFNAVAARQECVVSPTLIVPLPVCHVACMLHVLLYVQCVMSDDVCCVLGFVAQVAGPALRRTALQGVQHATAASSSSASAIAKSIRIATAGASLAATVNIQEGKLLYAQGQVYKALQVQLNTLTLEHPKHSQTFT